MSNHELFALINCLQTLTGSNGYSLENLLNRYKQCFPNDQLGISLLTFIIFSEGPIEDDCVDEVIAHLRTHAKKH